jgi:arsenate reductase (thioredoxin)
MEKPIEKPIEKPRKRVLFVCLGNACRSQMAEGFARTYGSDALIPASAGVSPAIAVAPDTIRAMLEKNIDLREHFPKSIRHLGRVQWDVVVNMSETFVSEDTGLRLVEWEVPDPVFMEYEDHCRVRDVIERNVMNLILELRREREITQFKGQGSGRVEL